MDSKRELVIPNTEAHIVHDIEDSQPNEDISGNMTKKKKKKINVFCLLFSMPNERGSRCHHSGLFRCLGIPTVKLEL